MKMVIIYGDMWTDCYAMDAIIRRRCLAEKVLMCDSVSVLVQYLSTFPDARMVLCLRPHEHVYFFYMLRGILKQHRVLVVADRLYYTDWCVMQYFGMGDYLLRNELTSFILPGSALPDRWFRFWCHRQLSSPEKTWKTDRGDGRITPEEVLFNINHYAQRHLPTGVSMEKYALLLVLSTGQAAGGLAKRIKLSPKTVSTYRIQAMERLGMVSSPLSLQRGVRLLKHLQRT